MGIDVERWFVRIPGGVVHCAVVGEGEPVLLLHQTPRSWDEYREVLPLLGRRRRAIAMDTPGFGDSTPLPPGEDSIERWAEAARDVLDALGARPAAVVGHHTGAYVAAELAVAHPGHVRAAVLSSLGLCTREERLAQLEAPPPVDEVARAADGSHLVELWRGRAPFYPADVGLLERYLIDCLRAGDLAAEGHRVVARYPAEERVGRIACPVLLVGASDDPHAYPGLGRLRAALPRAEVAVLEGGMIPLPDGLPGPFAAAVEGFLDGLD
ncbi:MAG TPA: alpha/beta hydrolase [Gaiellaceae bacterium]|nr:alpha/beta hydrolase [Gaiellaceae bacterium]